MPHRLTRFRNLTGPGFTEPLYELRPHRHLLFRIVRPLGFSPEGFNRCKFRIRHILNTPKNPFKRYQSEILLIRIPKNASSSLCDILYGRGRLTPHFTAQFLQQINPNRFQKAIKVAVVRNPQTRFPSAILYNQHKSPNPHDQRFARKFLSDSSPSELNQAMNKDADLRAKIFGQTHFRRQISYICDPQGEAIVDLLISIDSLAAGIQEISRVTGRQLKIVHRNASPRIISGESFKMAGAVREYYEPDFKLWNFVNDSKEGFVWLTAPPDAP